MEYLLLALPVVLVIFFIAVALFKWLWNITMPQVFNLRQITFWQAFRLLLIAGFLFGGQGVRFNSSDNSSSSVSSSFPFIIR